MSFVIIISNNTNLESSQNNWKLTEINTSSSNFNMQQVYQTKQSHTTRASIKKHKINVTKKYTIGKFVKDVLAKLAAIIFILLCSGFIYGAVRYFS